MAHVAQERPGVWARKKSGSVLKKRAAGFEAGPVLTVVLLLGPVVAAALFYVWTRVATVRLGYAISEAGAVHRTLLEENRGMRIEGAALRAPERLEKLGRERFGLGPPKPEQFIELPRTVR